MEKKIEKYIPDCGGTKKFNKSLEKLIKNLSIKEC